MKAEFVGSLVALSLVGCSHAPTMPPSPPIAPKGPSDEAYLSYDAAHGVIFVRGRDGKTHHWKFQSVQPTGEEKFIFERDGNYDSALLALKGPPTISFGKPFDGHEVFEATFEHFSAEADRLQDFIATNGFPPFGVSNDLYFGHTFWDMDVWMMPAMIFLAPDSARSAAKYRIDRSQQAHLNYLDWAKTNKKKYAIDGMKFPWESSVSGKEVCIQKTKKQEHISGDVVWGLTQAEAMGLADSAKVEMIARDVSTYYRERSTHTARGQEILDIISPNEKFEGNNDLYTNALAEWLAGHRNWNTKREFYFPSDPKSLLNYDDDPLTDYQQAAGLLAIYPLQCPAAETNARAMMDRFGDKISPNGPAMGQAVVATIWARLGEPEKAYAAWLDSWKPFVSGHQALFSERRNAFRPYFYTGAAGAIDTVLYGFLGLRIDRMPLSGAKWTQRLKSGWWLSAKPCVPEAIGSITVDGVTVDGRTVSITASTKGDFSVKGASVQAP